VELLQDFKSIFKKLIKNLSNMSDLDPTMLYQLADFSGVTADFAERKKGINYADETTKQRGRVRHQSTSKTRNNFKIINKTIFIHIKYSGKYYIH
jgi:hypothetical protein